MNKKPAVAMVGRPYYLSKSQRRLLVADRKWFSRVSTVPHTTWWRCYVERYSR